MEKLNAFYYMFKEKNWYKSIIIGTILFLPLFWTSTIILTNDPSREYSTYLILSALRWLCWFVVMFFISGYCLYNANQRLQNLTQNTVSWSKIKEITKSGLKFLGAQWIYAIPLFWILAITFYIFVTNATGDFYDPQRSKYYPLAIKYTNILSIIIGMIIPIAFVSDLKFKTFFNIKKIFLTIKENFSGFLLYIIFASIDFLGMQYLPIIATKWQVLTLPLVSFIAYYLMLIKSDFLAQLSKISTNE